jgi:predicted PhzF superfamily epimerase YddE/YHI9
MELSYTTVDVFTTTRFVGNPLAIIRIPASLRAKVTEEQKQKIAREFNFSESVFLHEVVDGEDFADYDIFTPRSRMSFAGHPTIGTSIYVSEHTEAYKSVTKLRTIAGLIPFTYDKQQGTIAITIPHDVRIHQKRLPHPFPGSELNPTSLPTVPIVSIVKGMAFNLVQMATLEALGAAKQGLIPIADVYKHEHLDSGSGWDVGYTGTFFYCDLCRDIEAPAADVRLLRTRSLGTIEDPGTGSASAALCSFLALEEIAEKGSGPFRFHLIQGVEMGRRCDIFVEVVREEDGKSIKGVKLSGNAVKVMEGFVTVD